MIKPNTLKRGDKIAVVSLSWGGLGDPEYIHKYEIAKARLEQEFGLEVVAMPHALLGTKYVLEHPEDRAKDLMDAFQDETIKGIICAIGGNDTIRTLPYIDFDIIKNNPKIFMGYSDTTVNHFMMKKAGLISFYGPTIMCEIGEYVKMFDYTKEAIENILFHDSENLEISSSPIWSSDYVPWSEENKNIAKKLREEEHGYEIIQGSGTVEGEILGGCLEVFPMMYGTDIWPNKEEWQDKILLIETSEEKPTPEELESLLKSLGEKEILEAIKGILVGKPQDEVYYEEYKEVYKKVLKEYQKDTLPVLYNINIGHAYPTGILPLGTKVRVDFDNKKVILLESATKEQNPVKKK